MSQLEIKDILNLFGLFIDREADVNAVTTIGRTPLHEASVAGNTEAATLLLARGANVAARTKDGETPLWLATSKYGEKYVYSSSMVAALLSAKADASAVPPSAPANLLNAHHSALMELLAEGQQKRNEMNMRSLVNVIEDIGEASGRQAIMINVYRYFVLLNAPHSSLTDVIIDRQQKLNEAHMKSTVSRLDGSVLMLASENNSAMSVTNVLMDEHKLSEANISMPDISSRDDKHLSSRVCDETNAKPISVTNNVASLTPL